MNRKTSGPNGRRPHTPEGKPLTNPAPGKPKNGPASGSDSEKISPAGATFGRPPENAARPQAGAAALPLRKNDDLTVTIETLTAEGQGIARVEGYTVFAEGALPGETVNIHVIKVTSGYAVAKVTEILTPSPDRTEPLCPVYARCGGCTLQHLSYERQKQVKRQTVYDALSRIGGIQNPPVEELRCMERPERYRNKGAFPLSGEPGMCTFGFYSPRSHRPVPVTDCLIQDERIISVANRVTAWADRHRITIYNEETGKGLLRHLMVRTTTTGEIMAVLVLALDRMPHADTLLAALPEVQSIWYNVNPRKTNVIFGETFKLLRGSETLTEEICGLSYSISPQSFLQVNPQQTRILYGEALRLLSPKPTETVVDAYCGAGTISLMVARRARRVLGIEAVPEAIEDAKANAALNGISNASFLCGNVEDLLPTLTEPDGSPFRPDCIVLDPPRKGCEEAVLRAIAKSSADRVVYVSCNPATLARDLKYLTAHGFTLMTAIPVDMFPHTGHVETVVLMSRKTE